MPKGQKPKPAAIKLAEGNRRKVALAQLGHDLKGKGQPRLPEHLTAEERRLWADVIAALPVGLFSRADEAVLERFAVGYARWRELQRMIAKSGFLINTPQGPVKNPLLSIQEKAEKSMHSAGEVIGLSPVARARLANADNTGEEDPMALLLGMDNDPSGAWATPRKH